MPIEITRKELYDQIWSRPMIKVAANYGISDVGLNKICKKHRIPVPGRGYNVSAAGFFLDWAGSKHHC